MSSKKKDLTSSISSQESAASVSDLSEQTPLFGQLPFVSAKPTPEQSLKSSGRKSLSTTMSEPYKQIDLEELTSSQGGILANHSALQGNNSERKMTAISGRKWLGLFDNATPLGCLQKMLLVTSQWASTMCYLTWKAKGTPQGRLLFQLVPLVRRTDAIEYSLLPTMTVSTGAQTKENPTPGQTGGTSLAGYARMFPTPRAMTIHNKLERLTPQGRMSADGKQRFGLNLEDAARMWPTPAASESRQGYQNRHNGAKGTQKSLTTEVVDSLGGREKEQKSLNPKWVEALMGFPAGWTALGKTEYQEYQKAKKAAQKGSKG